MFGLIYIKVWSICPYNVLEFGLQKCTNRVICSSNFICYQLSIVFVEFDGPQFVRKFYPLVNGARDIVHYLELCSH